MPKPRPLLAYVEDLKKPHPYERFRPYLDEIVQARSLGVPWTVIASWLTEECEMPVSSNHVARVVTRLTNG